MKGQRGKMGVKGPKEILMMSHRKTMPLAADKNTKNIEALALQATLL